MMNCFKIVATDALFASLLLIFCVASSINGLYFPKKPIRDELERESEAPVAQLNPTLTTEKKKQHSIGGENTNLPAQKPSPSLLASNPNLLDILVHEKEFVAPEVKIQMDCQREKTKIKFNFNKNFVGIIGTGNLATSPCKIVGNGTKNYELNVDHTSTKCGSNWDKASSSIFNNLSIRFHPTLETGSDIAKNLMCRLTVGDLIVGRKPNSATSSVVATSSDQQIAPQTLTSNE